MIEIVTFDIVVAHTPLNTQILKTAEFEVCKLLTIELYAMALLGERCYAEITDDTKGTEQKWLDLKKPVSQGGGGLEITLAWWVYVEWLKKFGEASVTTKGLKVRTDEGVSSAESKTFARMVEDAEKVATIFLERTKNFLHSHNCLYLCVKEKDECGCDKSPQIFLLPKFSVS